MKTFKSFNFNKVELDLKNDIKSNKIISTLTYGMKCAFKNLTFLDENNKCKLCNIHHFLTNE